MLTLYQGSGCPITFIYRVRIDQLITFIYRGPLSNAFFERSTLRGREQHWPKLQCLRVHLAKTTAREGKFG
jgi:hypothetical protein